MDSLDFDQAKLATARALVLDFLSRRIGGDGAQLDDLARERPELANELRAVWSELDARDTPPPTAHATDEPTRSTSALLASLEHPASKFARYRVGREIGRGGMGAVLEAWDAELNRTLAMKVLRAGASAWSPRDEAQLARFLEEAQITGQLDHPGIVPVHELGLDEHGRPFFTMRLVRGRDLRAIFELAWKGDEGWSETRALGVLLKVCEAMAFAHDKGVLHRDLKPANVMVGSFGEAYVMDWGVARVLGREGAQRASVATVREQSDAAPFVTRDGDVIGTPAYMAPEQARGELERLAPQSDVYAVGAMLYHLLARRAPYADKRGASALITAVLSGPPQPIASFEQDAAPELIAICDRAMAREPEQRYATMLAFADDLRAYLDGRVVAAYERGAWAEAKKWVKRNRALASAGAAAVLILVAGSIAIAVLQARRADDAATYAKGLKIEKENTALEAERARIEAATSGRISDFMTKIFRDQRPENQRGQAITAREILLQAAREIRSDFANDPETRLRLLTEISDALLSLGRPLDADPIVRDMRDAALSAYGPSDERTLGAEHRYACHALLWQDYEVAEERFAQLAQACVERGHATSEIAIKARIGVANCLRMRRAFEEAAAGALAAVEDARRALPADSLVVRDARETLAGIYSEMERFDDALELYDGLIRDCEASTPRDEVFLEQLLVHRDGTLDRRDGPEAAEARLRRRIEGLEGLAGAELKTARAYKELAINLVRQERHGEALHWFELRHALLTRQLGATHLETLASAVDVAEVCALIGEFERAEPIANEALTALRASSAGFNQPTSNVLRVLAKCAASDGRFDEALEFARERLQRAPSDDANRQEKEQLLAQIEALARQASSK